MGTRGRNGDKGQRDTGMGWGQGTWGQGYRNGMGTRDTGTRRWEGWGQGDGMGTKDTRTQRHEDRDTGMGWGQGMQGHGDQDTGMGWGQGHGRDGDKGHRDMGMRGMGTQGWRTWQQGDEDVRTWGWGEGHGRNKDGGEKGHRDRRGGHGPAPAGDRAEKRHRHLQPRPPAWGDLGDVVAWGVLEGSRSPCRVGGGGLVSPEGPHSSREAQGGPSVPRGFQCPQRVPIGPGRLKGGPGVPRGSPMSPGSHPAAARGSGLCRRGAG